MRRDAGRLPVHRQGPARRERPRALRRPGGVRALAHRDAARSSASGSAPCCSASRPRSRATTSGWRVSSAAWPRSIPLVVEAQHPSWTADETFAALRAAGAVLCTTDLDDQEEPPDIRRTGPFLYLRLRRTAYTDADLDAWARRLVPFLDDGMDAYVLFRHDEDGTSALHAEAFAARVDRVRAQG